VGVKCISFTGIWASSPDTLALQGGLFGAAVLFINIESWLLKRLINAATAEVLFKYSRPQSCALFSRAALLFIPALSLGPALPRSDRTWCVKPLRSRLQI
jgi:hypothetical protein